MEIDESEVSKYRKRSDTSHRSDSKRKADHTHDYEKVIIRSIIGYKWSGRCRICGKFQSQYSNYSRSGCQDFIRPECKNKPGISSGSFLSVAEIRSKYPGILIYKSSESGYENIP